MINKIKKMHNQIIIVSKPINDDVCSQYAYEIAEYIDGNCKKIEYNKKLNVDIYLKK